jgi:hypothetical protein
MGARKDYGYDSHMVRLFIINNPHIRNYDQIAEECMCCHKTVQKEMRVLNIPQSFKPWDCKG